MREIFNDGWSFALNDGDRPVKVDLPHDWQIEQLRSHDAPHGGSQGFYPRDGIGHYKKSFFAPSEWRDKSVVLTFDGIQRFSTVYLNGTIVGGRKYGYVQFDCDLTDALIFGSENLIEVTVDNSDCGPDRWYSGAGIYRNVWLNVTERRHIYNRGVWIIPRKSDNKQWSLNVRIFAENDGQPYKLMLYKDGELFYSGSFAENEFDAEVGEPEIWDIDNPALYDVEVWLGSEVYNTRIGFRTAVFDDDRGFLLNGRQVKLYGGDFHHDGGGFGAAVPIKVWKRRFERLKAIGGNAVRCSHNPQCEEFYALCDEMGILCIDELYDKWTEMYYAQLFETDRFDDLRSMVGRDINHPSVILWSVGNELSIQYSEKFYAYLSELCDACRRLDPSRGVSYALIGFVLRDFNDSTPLEKKLEAVKRYGDIVDVFMGNYMENYYAAMRAYGMKRAVIGSEVFTYYRHADLSTTQVIAKTPWDDIVENDWVAGGFVWSACDYIGEAATGWPAVGWTGAPIDSAGFIKHRGYYLKSRWSDEPMVYIAAFDEREKWDMANVQWGFPQMTAFWNGLDRGKIIHVGVYTNCEKVELYLNNDLPRIAYNDSPDRIAHFYMPFYGGRLRAVGYIGDKAVCEQTICECNSGLHLELTKYDGELIADGKDIMQIEAVLKDEMGQRRELDDREIRFEVSGEGRLAIVDNGDFTEPDKDFRSDKCRLHGGRALIVIRSTTNAGAIKVRAIADGIDEAVLETESR